MSYHWSDPEGPEVAKEEWDDLKKTFLTLGMYPLYKKFKGGSTSQDVAEKPENQNRNDLG